MGKKQKVRAVTSSKTLAKAIVDDDADQNISDDGEIPTYTGDDDEDEDMEDGSGSGSGSSGDDEEDDKMSDDAAPSLPNAHGANSAWKAPTTEEVANIKAASQLFKSNAFKLKIEALLPQVRPKASAKPTIEPFLLALHEHLRSLPSSPPQHPLQAFKKLQKQGGVRTLLAHPEPTDTTNWKVAFEAPSAIQLVGSWPDGLTVLGRGERAFCVDLAVEMPSSLFQEKDYLDARFFHKRAFFLASIAASLTKSTTLGVDVEYEVPAGNVRRTALLVRPKQGSKYDFKKLPAWIRIIPTLPSSSPIPLSRLSPSHTNLRLPSSSSSSSSSEPLPTPLYNNDMLLSTTPTLHLLLLHAASTEIPAFKDAVALLRVWANQRGFAPSDRAVVGFDGMGGGGGGSWWGCLILYVVWGDDQASLLLPAKEGGGGKRRKGKRTVGKGLSSYQLFRAVLDLLASHDFVKEPVRVRTPSGTQPTSFDLSGQRIPTFIGPSSPYNFLAGVPASSLHLLRHEARTTLQALDSQSLNDGFEPVFMHDQRDLQQRFDTVIRLNLVDAVIANDASSDPASKTDSLISQLDIVLRKALGSRARTIALIRASSSTHPLSQAQRNDNSGVIIDVGILLDPEHASKLVEHGPAPEDTQACEAFRQFWGPRAELRRFNDGRIIESVVWDLTGKATNERVQIPGRIVRYIVERHFSISPEAVTVFDTKYDGVLEQPEDVVARYSTVAVAKGATPESVQRLALTAFDELIRDIKAMENLPLGLVNAVPIDEGLRYTSALVPLPVSKKTLASRPDCAKYIPVAEIVLQFEQSTRWPDDLAAIQKVKIALLDAIAEGLLAKGAIHTTIVWDAEAKPLEDHVALEVLLSSGIAFRARVQHDRERTLMERIISDKRGVPEYERTRAQAALDRHTRRFILAPAHHATILSLQRQYPSYSHTVRLVKRWVSSHWLAPHVSSEAIELLSADIYLNPGVHEAPSSGHAGFARVLALLAMWDFRETPLAVPVYTSSGSESTKRATFSSEALGKVQDQFAAHIAVDPSLSRGAWTIATEQDLSGHAWTRGVTGLVAGRIRELAKATVGYMSASMAAGNLDVKAMFVHPTDDYDFVIHLQPAVVTRYTQSLFANPSVWGGGKKYANLMDAVPESVFGETLRLDFDPVSMLFKEIQHVYGDSMVLFYDPNGGTSIGGVWNPMLASLRPFRVLLGFSSEPSSEGSNGKKLNVTLNKSAILAEIQRIGTGLISSITQRSS